jgi:uncharacterized protein YndB with AHSA1/START domain
LDAPTTVGRPLAKVGMLIQKPAIEVYEAFVNPAITTRFWCTRSSGKLGTGLRFRWDWEMYGVSTAVVVKSLEPRKRILLEWGIDEEPTTVEWIFYAITDNKTFFSITKSGFSG